MRKIRTAAKFISLSVVVVLLIAVGAILSLRLHRQRVTAQAIAITVVQ